MWKAKSICQLTGFVSISYPNVKYNAFDLFSNLVELQRLNLYAINRKLETELYIELELKSCYSSMSG